jgi:hypothetical protein
LVDTSAAGVVAAELAFLRAQLLEVPALEATARDAERGGDSAAASSHDAGGGLPLVLQPCSAPAGCQEAAIGSAAVPKDARVGVSGRVDGQQAAGSAAPSFSNNGCEPKGMG